MDKNNNYSSDNKFQKPQSKAKKWAIGIVSMLCILGIIGGITAGVMIPKQNKVTSTNTVEQPSSNTSQTGLPYKDFNYIEYGFLEEALKDLPITMECQVNGKSREKFETRITNITEDSYHGVGFSIPFSEEYLRLKLVTPEEMKLLDASENSAIAVSNEWTLNGVKVSANADFLYNGYLLRFDAEDGYISIEKATGLNLTENIPISQLDIVFNFCFSVQ